MSDDTMDLYLVQDPADYPKAKDDGNYTGYLQDLLNAYKNAYQYTMLMISFGRLRVAAAAHPGSTAFCRDCRSAV
jgi:hypothetical protein